MYHKQISILSSLVLGVAFLSTASVAKTTAECEAMFNAADTDKDGTIAQMEDPKWEQRISHMSTITKKDQTIIQKDQFMQSCLKGEMDGM